MLENVIKGEERKLRWSICNINFVHLQFEFMIIKLSIALLFDIYLLVHHSLLVLTKIFKYIIDNLNLKKHCYHRHFWRIVRQPLWRN